jgi:hypothetical protein
MPRVDHVASWLVAAFICLAATAPPVAAETEFKAVLDPVGGTAVQATSSITVPDDGAGPTVLVLEADGLTPSTRYTVWLRAGTPKHPSASAALLGYLDAGDRGQATLTTAAAEAGAVGTHLQLSPELLGDGEHLIQISDPSLTIVAAGRVPAVQPLPAADPTAAGDQDGANGASVGSSAEAPLDLHHALACQS